MRTSFLVSGSSFGHLIFMAPHRSILFVWVSILLFHFVQFSPMPNFPLKACFRSNSLTLRPCSIFLEIVSKFFLPAGWLSKIFPHFMKVVKRPIAFSDVLLKYQGIAWKSFMILKRRHSRCSIIMPLRFASLLPLLIIGNKLHNDKIFCKWNEEYVIFDTFELILQLDRICCRCLYLGG